MVAVSLVADGLLDLHALPIGVQLIGRDQRQRGPDPGAHFRTVRDDEDRAVGLDAEVYAGVKRGQFGLRVERRSLGEQIARHDAR